MTNRQYEKYFPSQTAKYERKYLGRISKNLRKDLEGIVSRLKLCSNMGECETTIAQYNLSTENLIREMYLDIGETFYSVTRGVLLQKKFETFEAYVEEFMKAFAAEKIVSISDTTKSILNTILRQGFSSGLSIPKIVEKITNQVPLISTKRAIVIARTEVIGAANFGSFMAAVDVENEFPEFQIKKRWRANLDGRERAAHRNANGQQVDIKDDFIVGGERMLRPHDPRGSAMNVIQCRCFVMYTRGTEI